MNTREPEQWEIDEAEERVRAAERILARTGDEWLQRNQRQEVNRLRRIASDLRAR